MEIPKKIYYEADGEIFEYDFVQASVVDGLVKYIYTNDLIFHLYPTETLIDHIQYKMYWLNKEEMIKYRISLHEHSIQRYSEQIEQRQTFINKLKSQLL